MATTVKAATPAITSDELVVGAEEVAKLKRGEQRHHQRHQQHSEKGEGPRPCMHAPNAARERRRLFDDKLQLLDHRPDLRDLLAQHVAHLGLRRAGRLGADVGHALVHVGMLHRRGDFLLQARDRPAPACPWARGSRSSPAARDSGKPSSRTVGTFGSATDLVATAIALSWPERTCSSELDKLVAAELDAARDQVGDQRRRAAERHVIHLDAGVAFEHLAASDS